MADRKTKDSDISSTSTSPLQQVEDYVPSQPNEDDATSLYQSTSPGSLLNVGAQHAMKFSGPAQNMPGFGGNMDSGIAMTNSNTGFSGQQLPTYQNIPVKTGESSLFRGSEGHQLADQVITGSRGRGRGRGRGREPSLKRPATHPPATSARAAQRRNTIHPSTPASAQAAPSISHLTQIAPAPPQEQTAASLQSLPQDADFLHPLFLTLVQALVQALVPPQSQIAGFFPSMPQTLDFLQFLSRTRAPLRISQDQVIPSSTGRGLDQAPDASVGSSLKRSATEPPPIVARKDQHRPTIHPSDPASAQAAPSAAYPAQTALVQHQAETLFWPPGVRFPVQIADPPQAQTAAFRPSIPQHLSKTSADPPQAQTAGFHPSVPQTVDYLQHLSKTPADTPQAQTAGFCPSVTQTVDYLQYLSKTPAFPLSNSAKETPPPLRVSPDLDRAACANPQKQWMMCGLCGYDLSCTQGFKSILSCGHRCHTECLQFFPQNSACLACSQSFIDSYISSESKGKGKGI